MNKIIPKFYTVRLITLIPNLVKFNILYNEKTWYEITEKLKIVIITLYPLPNFYANSLAMTHEGSKHADVL